MRYVFIGVGLTLFILFAAALEYTLFEPQKSPQEAATTYATVTVGTTTLRAEVADTQERRMRGLSGREPLALGTGMLFVFEYENEWGIWMKDMRFPIDILWADSEGRIVSIAHGVSPETYPNAFYPAAPARFVLEIPAGFTAARGIAEGDRIVVQ